MKSLPEEIGTTIRAAIKEWPQTLRLISILATIIVPVVLAVLLRHRIG